MQVSSEQREVEETLMWCPSCKVGTAVFVRLPAAVPAVSLHRGTAVCSEPGNSDDRPGMRLADVLMWLAQRMVAPQAASESAPDEDRSGGTRPSAHRPRASADSTAQKGHAASYQAAQVSAQP